MKTTLSFLNLTITSHLLILLILIPLPLSSSKPTTTIEFPIITTGTGPSTTHLVPLRLGSPPQTMYVIPDTGSKATWIYCGRSPYHRDNISSRTTRSVFGFRRSSTFLPVKCSSSGSCVENGNCSLRHDLCRYRHEYVDGTLTAGHWVRESLSVKTGGGVEVKVNGVVIGCSSRRSSNLVDADGILGLSTVTSFSVPVSLTKKSSIQHIFSYFISTTKQNKNHDVLIFGKTNRPLFRQHKMQHIRLHPDHRDHTFSYVKINNLLVDGVNLSLPSKTWEFDPETGEGGVIIDTGTTFTYLPEAAFKAVHDVYADHLMGKFQKSSEITDVDVCVDSRDMEGVGMDLPELVVEFEGGARLVVVEEGLFYEDGGGMRCLGVRKGGDGVGIIVGSLFQREYFWEYDMKMRTLGFARIDDV